MENRFIDSVTALAEVCRQFAVDAFVAVDTEFVRERTYYPALALIQLANAERVVCIDPLAIDDLSPLQALFADESVVKVFHAASQDMEIFYHRFGELPWPVFDTQIAAAVLGAGEQVGYAALVKQVLDIELDKSHSRTDWLQRPLDARQIRYAEDDVRYLARLYPRQREMLVAQGRLDWLAPDFAALCDSGRYAPDPAVAWKRIKSVNRLRGVQVAVLQSLAAWREQAAMRQDVPRRRVVSDELLLDMARLRPKSMSSIGKLRGISNGWVHRYGETVMALIGEAERLPKERWPVLPSFKRLTPEQEALTDALMSIVKLCAAEYQLSAASLAGRKELERLVRGERDLPVLQGWRRGHGGERLLRFLEGEWSLRVLREALVMAPVGGAVTTNPDF